MEIEARKIIGEILQTYDNLQDKSDIEGFVKSQLREYGTYTNDADLDTAAQEICSTIDNIDSSFKDLQGCKKIGQSTNKWLEKQLNKVVNKLPESEQAKFTESFDFKGLNKAAVAKNFQEDIREFTLLNLVDDHSTEIIPKTDDKLKQPALSSVKDFFKAPLDSAEDLNIKKAVAAATVIAKEKGFIKSFETSSNEEIAATVDYGLTGVKAAYKVGTGEMKAIDAIDYMVDKSVAVVATVVKSAVEKGVALACEAVGIVVGNYFKNPIAVEAARQIGKAVGERAGKSAGEIVQKGIKMVGEQAKKVVKGLITGGKKFINFLTGKSNQPKQITAG
ncbi:MAG: hypothetical protein HQK63_01385 [Desulfamplus sp.]|nr:hypothetical protein [Desulfamplus sp.]